MVSAGINRYIMECKLNPFTAFLAAPFRINRYIMECKFTFNHSSPPIRLFELIDTLWNVNKEILISNTQDITELIDTLWNVNKSSASCIVPLIRINRYIMECK